MGGNKMMYATKKASVTETLKTNQGYEKVRKLLDKNRKTSGLLLMFLKPIKIPKDVVCQDNH